MKPICASSSRGTQRIRYGCGVREHQLVSILYTQALNTISVNACTLGWVICPFFKDINLRAPEPCSMTKNYKKKIEVSSIVPSA